MDYKIRVIDGNRKLIKNGKDIDTEIAITLTFKDFNDIDEFGFIAFGPDLLVTRYQKKLN